MEGGPDTHKWRHLRQGHLHNQPDMTHASSPPPSPPQSTSSGLLIILPFIIGIVFITYLIVACIQRAGRRERQRREVEELQQQTIARELVRLRTIDAINQIKQLRYCLNHEECSRLQRDFSKCFIVRDCCKENADCRDDACPDKGRGMDEGCVICLADFLDGDVLRVLPCRHFFHTDCADKWLVNQVAPGSDRTCPTCKAVALRVPEERESSHRQLWRERVREATEAERVPVPADPGMVFAV